MTRLCNSIRRFCKTKFVDKILPCRREWDVSKESLKMLKTLNLPLNTTHAQLEFVPALTALGILTDASVREKLMVAQKVEPAVFASNY